jgi:nickel-dependent lactate racemase
VQTVQVFTAAWYGDQTLDLEFPDGWDVQAHWPRTPPPLDDEAIAAAIASPLGQPPLSRLASGRRRVVILVDDLTRPTPAARILRPMLRQIEEAGVPRSGVTILVASGAHEPPGPSEIRRKVGAAITGAYRVLGHDYRGPLVRRGTTSLGTPVWFNETAARADLLIGVGGVYPQHSTGFGGGSKLVLGILGRRSIVRLHYGRDGAHGSNEVSNEFRRDLDEIAHMIGLRTLVTVHVDAHRRPVRVVAGDWTRHFMDSVAVSRQVYAAPPPDDADVVVANAYPMDVSLTFMRSKGIIPLLRGRPEASRIMVAACSEGVGSHGLFPFAVLPPFERERQMIRKAMARPREAPAKAARKVRNVMKRLPSRTRAGPRAGYGPPRPPGPIWLFGAKGPLPGSIPGMRPAETWEQTIRAVQGEQAGRGSLRVVVYPCAPLQVLPPARNAPLAEGMLDLE